MTSFRSLVLWTLIGLNLLWCKINAWMFPVRKAYNFIYIYKIIYISMELIYIYITMEFYEYKKNSPFYIKKKRNSHLMEVDWHSLTRALMHSIIHLINLFLIKSNSFCKHLKKLQYTQLCYLFNINNALCSFAFIQI